jgi:hypothetical protein
LNNKGQFSIIAALLVAVILISTVIVTYSTIRNSTIESQPQILSAIDETNFAIKQILGFTIGYYGSVLKVTGNSSYAKTLALNYLYSGLENIANMHPEWGTSFEVNEEETDLSTYWYTTTSYSTGNLAVNYSLTGLGIYGITYQTSCKLSIQIIKTNSTTQACLNVSKDENEPLINLAKQNFKFYSYEYENSTWQLVNPSTDPAAFANGTYLIDIPSGVDPYAYVIQVEDSRGIIVTASSFSRYTCTLTWNTTLTLAQRYVDNNSSDVDSSEDKGTHSNFPAQQAGPDSIYDTLMEQKAGNFTLLDDGFEAANWDANWDNIYHYWREDNSPVHSGSASASATNYYEGDFTCDNLDASDATAIYVEFWFMKDDTESTDFTLYYYDGSNYDLIDELDDNGNDDTWLHYSHKITDSQYFKSNFRIRFDATLGYGQNVWVDDVLIRKETQSSDDYQLNLEVQWTNAYYKATNEELCIYGGNMGSENLQVDVWDGSTWENLLVDLSSGWNNISVSSYLDSPTFTIRFKGGDETSDAVQDSWNIDATLLHVWPAEDLYQSLQDATIVVELQQNGTMQWLGQNLNLTTQSKPIPPIPVKAIHINQTINGINQEVPFQIEDWASNYKIPLGLTNNASVFGNRHMLVFLVNSKVSKVTIWWNGSDTTTQTPLAYTNIYFKDNIDTRTLYNGIQTLKFSTSGFTLTSTVKSTTSTVSLMRINDEYDNTPPELAYVIVNGIIRDIVHGESEYSGGAGSCPDVYSSIVITLPANATYYTYQLRLMFVESQQSRTITDLCPIKITTSGLPQTENGISGGYPVVQSGTGTFYNSSSVWQHHWSQIISGTRGAGIMFADEANKMLYTFDTSTTKTGALEVSTQTIELCPITMSSVSFTSAKDLTWYGAVVTFDGTTPIYEDGSGLWITVERPPTITVTTES